MPLTGGSEMAVYSGIPAALLVRRRCDSVSMTDINAVVYDANSMGPLWPVQIERGRFWFQH
ncbi:MAG: hypothetical protein KJO31_01490 [Gammaproteobacteria bacterium]|nr:hypothetical protein [Gammaproteobacteria bacterium]